MLGVLLIKTMEANVTNCIEDVCLSENAVKVLERRYLKRDKDGN